MDGAHDLGGRKDFGTVAPEPAEPVFHEAWEATAWALNMLAMSKLRVYKVDEYRHAVERMEPAWYLAARYYERWLTGTMTLFVEKGVVSVEELEQRAGGHIPLSEAAHALTVPQTEDTVATVARFAPGDPVTVTAAKTLGHTRCPAYLRGGRGIVRRVYPIAYYPELRAHSAIKCREHSYAVEFHASELWPDADHSQRVVAELFETYLEAA